jgi:hypothetical protein
MDRRLSNNPERWRRHSPMTDPAGQSFLLDDLPLEIEALCAIAQGVLIHCDWLSAYGLPQADPSSWSRETLPLSRRLLQIVQPDPRPLAVRRPAAGRSIVTCRDFALTLCGMLRHQGVPARICCGFAAYLGGNLWEDHWICESWSSAQNRWRRIDPQLDEVLKKRLAIRFDATDAPANMFVTAGDAWRLCRKGQSNPDDFGHGANRGLWFVRVNVMRDHCALNDFEVSKWDSWRLASGAHRLVSDQDQETTDRVALRPEEGNDVDLTPSWSA